MKMKMKMLAALVLATGLASLSTVRAADQKTEIATLSKTYPLKTCVVSGEKLDAMGEPYDIIYKEKVNGKETDKLVRFCCASCAKEFEKDPAKYMSKINDAVAKK